jgi:hypothetical protein
MQSVSAPARSRWHSWLRWGRVLLLGVLLGLLQTLLFFQAQALNQWSTSSLTSICLVALGYLLLPALEGFLTSRQSDHLSGGIGTGCLVGVMGFLIAALSISIWAASLPNTCGSGAAIACGGIAASGRAIIFSLLLWEGVGGVIGGLIGGGIGAILGERRVPASPQQWK